MGVGLKYGKSNLNGWIGNALGSDARCKDPAKTALPPQPPQERPDMTAPRPRRGLDNTPTSLGRGRRRGPGLQPRNTRVNGAAKPVVREAPAMPPPKKMRVVVAASAPGDAVASRGSGLTRGPAADSRGSLTTGQPLANGRGLTSGWGMINGTGMVRESEFHRSVGRFNGSGVTRSASLGSRDGMTNGSGLTEASGLADDAGMTNGCGLTHGEGMTNGCGLVRPMDPSLPPPRPRSRPRRGVLAMLGL